jgi:hypothetical protein
MPTQTNKSKNARVLKGSSNDLDSARKRRSVNKLNKRVHSSNNKSKVWDFPRYPLEEAVRIAQRINESSGNAAIPEFVAEIYGLRPTSSIFQNLLNTAVQYGIVAPAKHSEKISLTEIGLNIVAPTSPEQRQSALWKAFTAVELFRKVTELYAGKPLPEQEFFKNILVRDFKIPRDQVERFIAVFTQNLEYLKAFVSDDSDQPLLPAWGHEPSTTSTTDISTSAAISSDSDSLREFLDTCFILMPFGDWFDRYFKEIYVPATKDAGFEPLRADELFSAGAVMEQIWTQIRKAKILLADLTGKNPNVFYELGLAHALRKPVVFVAADIEDVPFDVRHLRVVVYDIREPNWSEKLRREITTYLSNTRTDPEKSIPQPYRERSSEFLEEQTSTVAISAKKRKST